MSEIVDLKAAMEARLGTISGLPASTQWQRENIGVRPTVGTAHLRLRYAHDPAEPLEAPASMSRIRKAGVFEVRCFYPPLDGAAASDAAAQAILEGFPYGLILTSGATMVNIPRGSRRWGGGLDEEQAWWVVLVEIRWEIVANNTLA